MHEAPLHLPTTTTFFSRLLSSEGLRLSCEGLLKTVFSWFLSASVNDRAFPLSDVTLSLVSVLSRWARSCSVMDRTRFNAVAPTFRFRGEALAENKRISNQKRTGLSLRCYWCWQLSLVTYCSVEWAMVSVFLSFCYTHLPLPASQPNVNTNFN